MKKIFLILLTVIMMLSAVACQATPDEVIVVKKDTERMIEQASQPDNGKTMDVLEIPEGRYTFSSTGLDGRFRIEVDADIERPNEEALPIVRVKMGDFSQELVTKIFNYFFSDQLAYDVSDNVQTKSDMEKYLLETKQQLTDGSYAERGYTEEEWREYIAELEELYKNAPETASQKSVSEGMMRLRYSENVGDYYELNVDTVADSNINGIQDRMIMRVVSHASDQACRNGFDSRLYYQKYVNGKIPPNYNTQSIVRIDSKADLPEEARESLTISIDEAKSICDSFFSTIGLSDEIHFGYAFLVGDWGAGKYGGDGKEMGASAENYAYRVYYTRATMGTTSFVNMNWAQADHEHSIPWGYECICLTVNDNGIETIHWNNPVTALETVQESSVMKSFDEIISIFETMVKVEYEAYLDLFAGERGEMDMDISAIQLCHVRVREPNANDVTGFLVPAWVFYGNNRMVCEDGHIIYDCRPGGSANTWRQEPFPVLIINAIDGSIIDLEKGY